MGLIIKYLSYVFLRFQLFFIFLTSESSQVSKQSNLKCAAALSLSVFILLLSLAIKVYKNTHDVLDSPSQGVLKMSFSYYSA